MSEAYTLTVNPGRSARVSGAGFALELDRVSPVRVDVRFQNHPVRLTEGQATACMRAFAAVLGYEIGERYEC